MRKVYRTRTFTRWMRKAGVTDALLCKAVDEMAAGLIDADLGGNVVKKRIPLPGQGKRGGARTIVATRMERRWFFVFGFAKNERASIDSTELKALQALAQEYLALDTIEIAIAVRHGKFNEVCCGEEQAAG